MGLRLAAAALAATCATTVNAQTYINGSGATLFVDFFGLDGGTNDAIDVDSDGVFGFDSNTFVVDQLAESFSFGSPPPASSHWVFHYRSVGSVNGYREFVDSQLTVGAPPYTVNPAIPTEAGIINRDRYAASGVILFGGANDGTGYPSNLVARDQNVVDFAFLDVPSQWGTRIETGTGSWTSKPGQGGYGNNPLTSSTGLDNRLVSIVRGGQSLNFNATDGDPGTVPDANTLYDTSVAYVPVVPIANRGAGIETIKATDWQFGAVTGRSSTGENLQFTTRDTGSGTHNAWMNSLGIDPSHGVGENVGDKARTSSVGLLGEDHAVGNAGGSSIMEEIVRHSRLAVGYTGLFGGSRAAADATAGRYEMLNLINDHVGGTLPVRPTVDSVLDNTDPNTAYIIGGAGSFVTRGDPLALAHNTAIYNNPGNANPQIANPQMALYLQNILGSIAQFDGADDVDNDGILDVVDDNINGQPNDNNQLNMPGDILALNFTLLAGLDALPALDNPTNYQANGALNQLLQDFIRDENVTVTPDFGSVSDAGLVPTRKDLSDAGAYADGQVQNYAYYDDQNTLQTAVAGTELSQRNALQGDFNNDGKRDWNDLDEMVGALAAPLDFEKGVDHGGSDGDMVGDYAIAHVIGDHDGDGDLTAEDVRYAADGLAMDPATGKLNRKEGFVRVDTADGGNLFGTTLKTGKPYAAGDSRGDIAGPGNLVGSVLAGSTPSGHDGAIDENDIDYVQSQRFGAWADLLTNAAADIAALHRTHIVTGELMRADLSADMNGDLVVNDDDVTELVEVILATKRGDVDLDRDIDITDFNALASRFTPGGYDGWAASPTPLYAPEPAGAMVLVMGAMMIARRRPSNVKGRR